MVVHDLREVLHEERAIALVKSATQWVKLWHFSAFFKIFASLRCKGLAISAFSTARDQIANGAVRSLISLNLCVMPRRPHQVLKAG